MTTNIFSRTKEGLSTILTDSLVTPGYVQALYTYRVYDLDTSPILIVTIYDYNYRDEDGADLVDVGVICAAKFSGQSEAEAAEQVLDDVEQIIINLFNPFDGSKQVHDDFWGAVDFVPTQSRPPSPFGAGTRYLEKILRIHAYGN